MPILLMVNREGNIVVIHIICPGTSIHPHKCDHNTEQYNDRNSKAIATINAFAYILLPIKIDPTYVKASYVCTPIYYGGEEGS